MSSRSTTPGTGTGTMSSGQQQQGNIFVYPIHAGKYNDYPWPSVTG